MVIVKLWGGIGNQLFQYVFGQYIRYRYNQDVCYDDNAFVTVDCLRKPELEAVKGNIVYNNQCSFSKYKGIVNRGLRYVFQAHPRHHFIMEGDKIPLEYKRDHLYFIQGYWQDIKYYAWLCDNVKDFELGGREFPLQLESFREEIISSTHSLSIHVRRGDYFSPRNIRTYGVCTVGYYQRAIDEICLRVEIEKIFVFSDDLDWVRGNLSLSKKATYLPNYDVNQFAYIQLMSLCRHHVISNSSFSWWGAVLNEQPNAIIISPNKWTLNSEKTIALDKWIKI